MKNYLMYLMLALIFSACEMVSFPEPDVNEPVFYAKGSIGSQALDYVAGKSGYFMHTESVEDNGLVFFQGRLAPKECTAMCRNSLRLRILADGVTDQPSLAFASGDRVLNTTRERAKMQTTVTNNNTTTGIEERNASFMLNDELMKPGTALTTVLGIKTLTFSAQYGEKLSVKMQTTVNPRLSKTVFPTAIIEAGPKAVRIKIDAARLKSLEWSNGSKGNVVEISSETAGRMVANAIDQNGESYVFAFEFKLTSNSDSFSVNLNVGAEVVKIEEPENPRQINTIIVEYMDDQGRIFSSRDAEQTQDSRVQISNSEEFETNADGLKTRKLKLKVQCVLSNQTDQESLIVDNLELSFAFGYGG